MKKRIPLLLVILIILLTVSVSGESLHLAKSVTVDVEVSTGMNIKNTASDAMIKFIEANLSFVPKETSSQQVLRVTAEPKPVKAGDEFSFRWEEPEQGDLFFNLQARIKTDSKLVKVSTTKFPIGDVPEDVKRFLVPGTNVDSDNPKVIAQASEIAAGETDLYALVFKMADWTGKNIEYNLSTLTAKASKSASWVLENRQGVCDEITTLFIGMLRSVGVPAKFVSGVAYTDSPLFPENWGGHGWAEVYFPGSGWVPFDVTYGQYGWVDATHVTFQEDADSGQSSLKYLWLGRSVKIETKPIKVTAQTVSSSGKIQDYIGLNIDMLQDEVGIGSYNLAEVTVENLVDGYVSTVVYLAKIDELEVEEGQSKAIYLKPREKKKIYWLVKVDPKLDTNYVYSFPMTAIDTVNTSSDKVFTVQPGATVFTRQEMDKIKKTLEEGETKIYSKEVSVNCTQEKEEYYVYEKPVVECNVKNMGNFPFKDLEFCYDDECEKEDLAITQKKSFRHEVSGGTEGINKIGFTVRGKDIAKAEFYDLKILDEPKIAITNVTYPKEIEFEKEYSFEFLLTKESSSNPKDVVLLMNVAGKEKKIDVGEMKGDKKYVFNLNSEDLTTKPNKITIKVEFKDGTGRSYGTANEEEINLINVTFGQKMVIFLKQLDRKIRNLFK